MIGKIFISYARADKSFATKLARLLRREGFDLWIDQDIRAGARWDNEIQAALTSAAIVLVILSPASVSSENVLDEVAYALDNGKPVVPLRLQQCNVPLRLTRLQHIDFQGDFDTAFRYCLDELRHRLLQTTEVDARPALSGPATEPRPDAGGVLRIIRYSKYRDRIRRYELYANGKKLGDIANNTQTDFAVPAGQLSIEARIDWCGSKPLVLQIGSNQRLDVEVVNETSLWSFPFVLLFDWSNYLALKPMRSEWAHALGADRRLAPVQGSCRCRPFSREHAPRRFEQTETDMAVQLNHTILYSRDSRASARFLAEVLGLPAPVHWGPFEVVATENGANLDYLDTDDEIASQHYAFLVSEAEFDEIFGRIKQRKLAYWADPGQSQRGEINRHDGGRGLYFEDPNGHLFEIITRPYGSGGWNP